MTTAIMPIPKLPKPFKSGFTLVELMVTIAILLVLALFLLPSFMKVADGFKLRDETSQVESLVRKTMAAGITQSVNSRVIIVDDTVTGFIIQDGVQEEVASHQLDPEIAFTRTNAAETPWVNSTATGSLIYPDGQGVNGQLDFNTFGLPGRGAAIFLENGDKTAVIEILASGQIKTYHWEDNEWTK